MDLARARSPKPDEVAAERARFARALQPLLDHPGPKIVITDSQVGVGGMGRLIFGPGSERLCGADLAQI